MSTILIVEGNDAGRDTLARRLEARNYSVLTAAEGREGVLRARESQPDLILMGSSSNSFSRASAHV